MIRFTKAPAQHCLHQIKLFLFAKNINTPFCFGSVAMIFVQLVDSSLIFYNEYIVYHNADKKTF